MSELDVLAAIEFRTEMQWMIFQWWVSASFAVMVAAYLGAEKLTKMIAALIIIMYTFGSANAANAMLNHDSYMTDAYEALQLVSESTDLSPMGRGALERRAERSYTSRNAMFLALFFLSVGSVLYSYKFVRNTE